jgi:hypothetical protein
MITDFPAKKIYNTGGYTAFQFVPYYNVLTYPAIAAGEVLAPVTLVAGTSWLNGYSTPGTLLLTEQPTSDENGIIYNISITGIAPGDKSELFDQMQGMENNVPFLVLLRDAQKKLRLVGSPAVPLIFSSNFSSGALKSDLKAFTFTFTGQCLYRAPQYNV